MLQLATAPALAEELMSKMELRTARVTVVGLDYIGLPLAETFAWSEFPVTGFDLDPEKVRKLRLGESYLGPIDSQRVAELVRSGRFNITTDPRCFEVADAIILCVPTPLTEAREPDLSSLVNIGKTLSKYLRRGQLVVLESTTYPGTTDEVLKPILEESGLKAGEDFFLAFSPEQEDPGNGDSTTRTIPKVVGGMDATSRELAIVLYGTIVPAVVPVSSTRVAEACKMLENTYRAVNIALVNELKVVFDAMGIDVWEVIDGAKTKSFGFQAFYPGPGAGGPGIPSDPFSLTWAARRYGINPRFIELAGEVNASMPRYVVNRVGDALNEQARSIKGSRILVLGAARKKDGDDPRESPAFTIMELLQQRGAHVAYNDPYIPVLPLLRHHALRLTSQPLTEDLLAAQDCVVIVTDHSRYKYDWIVRHSRAIVDTRNATEGVEPNGCHIWKA